MKNRTAIIGIMAAATISITACGSGDNGITDTAGDFTPANTAQAEANNVDTTQTATPNHITKNIGELAGITNHATGTTVLGITVTNISLEQQCTNVYNEPLPGNYVKVTLHVTTDGLPTINSHILNADHWSITDTAGTEHTDTNTSCQGSTDLLGLDETGERDITFYLRDPGNADTVLLTMPNTTDAKTGWAWNIP